MNQNPTATALVDYAASDDVDLSYQVGNIVRVMKMSPGIEWWKAELNGKTGMVHKDSFKLDKYIAVADYPEPQTGELKLFSGDIIDIVAVQKYKWIGKNENGQEGIIDPIYVALLPIAPKKTDTLDRIKPYHVLEDVRKDRPRKPSSGGGFYANRPRAPTFDMTSTVQEIEEEKEEPVLMRTKLMMHASPPWVKELNERTKTNSLFTTNVIEDQKPFPRSFEIRNRELPKNFSKIKSMWNQGFDATTSTTSTSTSTSTVRSSFDNGILRKSVRIQSFEETPSDANGVQRRSLTTTFVQKSFETKPISVVETIKVEERPPRCRAIPVPIGDKNVQPVEVVQSKKGQGAIPKICELPKLPAMELPIVTKQCQAMPSMELPTVPPRHPRQHAEPAPIQAPKQTETEVKSSALELRLNSTPESQLIVEPVQIVENKIEVNLIEPNSRSTTTISRAGVDVKAEEPITPKSMYETKVLDRETPVAAIATRAKADNLTTGLEPKTANGEMDGDATAAAIRALQADNEDMRRRMLALEKRLDIIIEKVLS